MKMTLTERIHSLIKKDNTDDIKTLLIIDFSPDLNSFVKGQIIINSPFESYNFYLVKYMVRK